MKTDHRFVVGIVLGVSMFGRGTQAFAESWSPEVTIFPQQASLATNAFALNAGGNEVWVTGTQETSLTSTASAAQRAFGGSWSALATIATVHATSLPVGVALSASNFAVATWEDVIERRSPAGVWQTPVDLALTGSVSNFQAKLDAQGNGVAVWGRLTDTNSQIEAVTWTAAGTFGSVVQLSPSSHGAFLPQLAVNDAGTAVVVWLASPPRDNADPYQVESTTRPAGGAWGAVTTASPNVPQTWGAAVALDAAGDATAIWMTETTMTSEHLYAASRPAGGAWGTPTQIEPSSWNTVSQNSMAADAAGDVTVSWVGQDATGQNNVRTATRSAGGAWGAPTTLGQCKVVVSLCLVQVSAAPDGSITVVGWGATGPTLDNVAVRLASGAWTPMAVGTSSPQLKYVLATNNAHASVVWTASIGVRYKLDLRQSDYK
jgi:hypothetical protein